MGTIGNISMIIIMRMMTTITMLMVTKVTSSSKPFVNDNGNLENVRIVLQSRIPVMLQSSLSQVIPAPMISHRNMHKEQWEMTEKKFISIL
jgi:hypothetical protein